MLRGDIPIQHNHRLVVNSPPSKQRSRVRFPMVVKYFFDALLAQLVRAYA